MATWGFENSVCSTRCLFSPFFADMGNNGSIPFPMLARNSKSFWRSKIFHSMFNQVAEVDWKDKKSVAFFRGHIHGLDPTCFAKPYPTRSFCVRTQMISRLRSDPNFDVGVDFVQEKRWEDNKYILIMGNSFGWADRTMSALFKSSLPIFVDQSSFDWFIPMMKHKKHFLFAKPTKESIIEHVNWAREHDKEAEEMVKNVNEFAKDTFRIENLARYAGLVAKAYSKTLAYKPKMREGHALFQV